MARISFATIRRLSRYYRSLEQAESREISTISSDELARLNGLTAAQVRKDLSFFGAFGRRGLGYNVPDLKRNIAKILGLDKSWNVAVVGAGNVGRALLNFDQFKKQGFIIKLILDNDQNKIGTQIAGLQVKDMQHLAQEMRANSIEIAVICVPGHAAQKIVDMCVSEEAGVKAILNFAPVPIFVPKGIALRNINMAVEIERQAFPASKPRPL